MITSPSWLEEDGILPRKMEAEKEACKPLSLPCEMGLRAREKPLQTRQLEKPRQNIISALCEVPLCEVPFTT